VTRSSRISAGPHEILQDCTLQSATSDGEERVELYNLPFELEGPSQAKVTAGVAAVRLEFAHRGPGG